MDELISIIIPIYNAERYIEKCVKSIIVQTYHKIEIILIDDGSIDKSPQICDKLATKDVRIKVIHKKNEGVACARNDGLHLARGEFITFIDSDDWVEENFIETLYKALKYNEVDVVRGNFYKESLTGIFESGKMCDFENKKIEKNDNKLRNKLMQDILNGNFLSYVWLLLIRRNLLIEKNIKFKRDVSFMEDTMFYLEIVASKASIFIINRNIYHYNDNLESASKSLGNAQKNILNILNVNSEMNGILDRYNVPNRQMLNKYMCTNHLNMVLNLYFKLYKGQILKTNELKYEINKIIENAKFDSILKNSSEEIMPIHFKIQYWCVKNKEIKKLILYYKVRMIFAKIKNQYKKRRSV